MNNKTPTAPLDPIVQFDTEVARNIASLSGARELHDASLEWLRATLPYRYSYNFTWLGRPIIQYPQDMVAVQELIWRIRPDLIIEAGVAHGGSLILSASLLALLDYCDAANARLPLDASASRRHVIGIDIDVRTHNRRAIQEHPLAHKISLLEGSSIAADTIDQVRQFARGYSRIMVLLDSNHTHEHVLAELRAYAPMVSPGSYCVVFDTIIEHLPNESYTDRPWSTGNNPLTAVRQYLSELQSLGAVGEDGGALRFRVDSAIDAKLLVSVAPEGYLRRTSGEE